MAFDEKGNPVTITEVGIGKSTSTDPEPEPDVTVGDPSAPKKPDQDPEPDEDPSVSEPHGRKPGAEQRIGQLVGERDYWKNIATQPVSTPVTDTPADTPAELDPDDFDSNRDYLKAVAEQVKMEIRTEVETTLGAEAATKEKAAIQKSGENARKAHADFDAVALNPAVPTSQTMVDAMQGENYAEILYALGKNIPEASRIFGLSPVQQIKEIGMIESRITKQKPVNVTSAPAPVTTVTGNNTGPPTKDPADMTRKELHSKWEKEREEELRRKYG